MTKKTRVIVEAALGKMIEEALEGEKHVGVAKLTRSLMMVAAPKEKDESYSGDRGPTVPVVKEDPEALSPLMGDIGKEAESNYLVRDIMTTLGEDEKLRDEMRAAMEAESDPMELDIFKTALDTITKTIREKQGMIQVLSKSKKNMPEGLTFLRQLIDEAVSKHMIMTEKAPPGMEDVVLSLKKKYGEDSPRPFQIAWAAHNKKKKKKKGE